MVGCLLSLLQLKGETKHNRNKLDSEKKFKLNINGREANPTTEDRGRFTERCKTHKDTFLKDKLDEMEGRKAFPPA